MYYEELVGTTVRNYTFLEIIPLERKRRAKARVRCKCGREYVRDIYNILHYDTNKCPKCSIVSLVGKKFGKLRVLAQFRYKKNIVCRVICDCGTVKLIDKYDLSHGSTRSCGCSQGDFLRKRAKKISENFTKKFIGKRIGRLVVVSREPNNRYGKGIFKCRCDCGKEITRLADSLKLAENKNSVASCGCFNSERGKKRSKKIADKYEECIGNKYNMLTVLKVEDGRGKYGHKLLTVECDCGNVKTMRATQIINGKLKSCGCLLMKQRAKFGSVFKRYKEERL